MKRIIFLTRRFAPEPCAGLPLAKWLADNGYAVKVMTAFPNYPTGKIYPGYRLRPWQWETLGGIPILRLPIYPSHDRSALRRALTYTSFALAASTLGTALVGAGEILYLPQFPVTEGLTATLLGAIRGAAIVCHVADLWPDAVVGSGMIRSTRIRSATSRVLSTTYRALYRRVAAITVPSSGLKRRLVDRGVPEHKISVVYEPVAEDTFAPVARDAAVGAAFGLTGRFNVVYAGNLGPFQGLHTLVDAAARLTQHPEIQFTLFGTGTKETELRTHAEDLGLANVRFFGTQAYAKMPQINAWADAFVVHLANTAGVEDAIPSKTAIAMACARPVLMGSSGEAGDLVRNARAGIVCRSGDAGDMARAIMELYRMPVAQREAMGRSGRAFYQEHLSLAVAGNQMDRIFASIPNGKSRSEPPATS